MVVGGGFRVFVCNTVTGRITADLVTSDQSFGMRLNDSGAVSVSLRPRAAEYRDVNLRSHTRPLMQSLGISYGGRVLECGPIWQRSVDPESGDLQLEAEGIWSLFDVRKAVHGAMLLPGANVTASSIALAGLSFGGIARELVRISLEDNPYGGQLPIVLPADLGAGIHTKEYLGYDLAWVGERLRDLTALQGGPDIRFRPRFNGADPSRVEWVMEYGTEEQPLLQQTGADWFWDGTAPKSGVVGFGHSEDARELASKAWVPGSGQERSMLVASALSTVLVEDGMPWTEADRAEKDIETLPALQSYADRLLADSLSPWDTFTVKVRADRFPFLGQYRPGDWAVVVVPKDHPTLTPGRLRVRIMAVDGDGSDAVSVVVAPLQDERIDDRGAGQTTVTSEDTGAMPGAWTALPAGTWADLPAGTWNEVI